MLEGLEVVIVEPLAVGAGESCGDSSELMSMVEGSGGEKTGGSAAGEGDQVDSVHLGHAATHAQEIERERETREGETTAATAAAAVADASVDCQESNWEW